MPSERLSGLLRNERSELLLITFVFRFFHFGFDKPDNVDEIGQPINEEYVDDSMLFHDDQNQHDLDYDDVSSEKNEPESLTETQPELELDDVKEPPPDEGIQLTVMKETFPQILPKKEVSESALNLKRSESALNIFDQATILKLFTAKNWTETFFNRIFRKKFLLPDADSLAAFKHGFDFEEHMMHFSQKYPRDFLPAIASQRDKKLTNGLLTFSPQPSSCMQDVFVNSLALVVQSVERGSSESL